MTIKDVDALRRSVGGRFLMLAENFVFGKWFHKFVFLRAHSNDTPANFYTQFKQIELSLNNVQILDVIQICLLVRYCLKGYLRK